MINGLYKRQKPLVLATVVILALGVVALALSVVDDVQILGINRWIKPAKFFLSTGIFLGTVAIYLDNLRNNERFSRRISWLMILIFIFELGAVAGQAIRGTTSHFNVSNGFDGILFALMGLAIVLNTFLVVLILYKYFRSEIDLPATVLWGMRLGLIIFLAGSFQGGHMSANMSHTVGAVDGGSGLPFANWSTVAGDLRVAHFLGLHSLQVIPLFAISLERFDVSKRNLLVFAFATLYFALFGLLFAQALLGRPFLSF